MPGDGPGGGYYTDEELRRKAADRAAAAASAPPPAPAPAEPAPAPAAEDETLADRILRQSVHGLDDHLLPAPEKRRRDLVKQLDKPLTASGWAKFCAGHAHAVEHGKPKAQRHAERTLVETVRPVARRRGRAGARSHGNA